MARKRKKNKEKRIHFFSAKQAAESVKRNKWQLIGTIAVVTIMIFLGLGLKSFLFASEFFNVSEIEVIDQAPNKVTYPLARLKDNPNIFRVDLDGLAANIEREHSDIQKAIVNRVLPNKLVIKILRRLPVLQLEIARPDKGSKENYYVSVNKDGYFLADNGSRPFRDLPLVTGTGVSLKDVEMGKHSSDSDLGHVLDFLDRFDKIGFFKDYTITRIEVTHPKNITFYLNGRLEVRIGNRKMEERLENLAGILKNMNMEKSGNYYVDLRFKDFIFGKK